MEWKAEKNLQFIERKKIVLNLKEGYAGTMDVAARGWAGEKMVVDWKTRKTDPRYPIKPYETQILQIAAYAAAYWGEGPVRNGEVYGVNFLISYLSQFMSLQPGDIISTGTPPGVGMGMKPQVFLKAGDKIRLSIDNLGEQNSKVVLV